MKTRAAVLREIGADWSVEEIELDEPKAGEILVKTTAAGMCHSDEHVVTGDLAGATPPMPIIGGHEGAGVVMEVGEGVTGLAVGDRVGVTLLKVAPPAEQPAIDEVKLAPQLVEPILHRRAGERDTPAGT